MAAPFCTTAPPASRISHGVVASNELDTPLALSVPPETVAPCSGVVTLTRARVSIGSAAAKPSSEETPKTCVWLPSPSVKTTGLRDCRTP